MNFEKINFGSISGKLSRAEMKKIMAGSSEEGGAGRCVQCSCHYAGTSCWYTTRTTHELCSSVCGNSNFSALDNVNCEAAGCIMN